MSYDVNLALYDTGSCNPSCDQEHLACRVAVVQVRAMFSKRRIFPPKFPGICSLKLMKSYAWLMEKSNFYPASKGAHWPFFFPFFPDSALDLLHLVFLNMMYEDVGHQWHWLKDFSYFSLFVRLPKLLSHGNVKSAIQHALSHTLLW